MVADLGPTGRWGRGFLDANVKAVLQAKTRADDGEASVVQPKESLQQTVSAELQRFHL